MNKMIGEGGYGCIYYPGFDCDGKKTDFVSKIVTLVDAKREISISNIIKKIPDYDKYFLPIMNHCNIQEKKLPVKLCKTLKPSSKFKVLYVKYMKKKNKLVSFEPTYHYLLQAIQKLIKFKIVHFDLHDSNIILADNPYLIDFGISMNMKKVHTYIKTNFYIYDPSVYIWPLEVHMICYMVNIGRITHEMIEYTCNTFVENHSILKRSSPSFIEEYLTESKNYFSKLLHMPKEMAIRKCLKSWKTWDNYALIMYFFDGGLSIPSLFLKNIHYKPEERHTVEYCLAATRSFGSATSASSTATAASATSASSS
jgi:serine/threonine protein kinase